MNMISPLKSVTRGAVLSVACGILLLAVFRVVRAIVLPELPNFSPIAAVAFCGGLFLPGRMAWIVPLTALLVSDVLLSLFLGYPIVGGWQIVSWLAIAAIVGIGRLMARRDFSTVGFFSAVLGSGVLFYLVTNSAAWLMNPAYPSGLGGLVMSLTTGLPGFPPSWVFLRNSLASDLVFSGLLLGVWILARRGALRQRTCDAV
jgi:hypothetical protein